MKMAATPIPVIAGPTATGKTAYGVSLAERLGAEIISVDSRQVFRELTIGTAKPTTEELARVRHHFVNERSLGDPWSAGVFAEEAEERIRSLRSAGKQVILVGGSTLYLRALVQGLAEIPAVDPNVRTRLSNRLADEGAQTLYDELQTVDPASAATMDSTKTQRILRALEVYHGSGTPLSWFHGREPHPAFSYDITVLTRPRENLYERIERRVDVMLRAGLIEEVRALVRAGHDLSLNPLRTIGYQEVIAHLRGEVDYDEMVRLIKRNTRRYAKRQLTWFRKLEQAEWIELTAD